MKNKTIRQQELDEKIGAWMKFFDIEWDMRADFITATNALQHLHNTHPHIYPMCNIYNSNDEWDWDKGAEILQESVNRLLNEYCHHLTKRMPIKTVLYYQMNFLKMKAKEIQEMFNDLEKERKS